eukprot:2189421-Rhodomonas_salina.2
MSCDTWNCNALCLVPPYAYVIRDVSTTDAVADTIRHASTTHAVSGTIRHVCTPCDTSWLYKVRPMLVPPPPPSSLLPPQRIANEIPYAISAQKTMSVPGIP